MDPRDRADEALARARARRAFVVTPDRATSPMDAQNTVQIPRAMVHGAQPPGRPGPAGTMPLPSRGQPPHPHPQPGQPNPPQQPGSPHGTHPGLPVPGPQAPGQAQHPMPGQPPQGGPGMHPQNGHPAGPHPGQQPTTQFPPPGAQYGGPPPGQHFGPGQPDQPTLPPPRPER